MRSLFSPTPAKAEAELTVRRLAGPALRDTLTGRIPTEIDPEMGEQRASAEFPWPALCNRETIPQSR